MTRPLDLANDLAELVNPQPQADLDPEAAGLGDDGLLVPDLDPQLEALLGDGGASGRMRGVAADIALDDGAYRGRLSSRAALFDEPDFDQASSEGGGGSDSEQQEEERGRPQFTSPSRLRTVAVSPERDISRYKTMFVNGHHKPGDPVAEHSTDSSSSDGDEGSDSDREQQDGQQQQQEQDMNGHDHLQDTVQQQHQQMGTAGVVHLQQQRHQSPPASLVAAPTQQQQQQQHQHQHQQPEASQSHSHLDGQGAGDVQLATATPAAEQPEDEGVEDEDMADEQSGDLPGDESVEQQGDAGSSSEDGSGSEEGSSSEERSQDEGDEDDSTAAAAAAAAAHDAADDGDAAGDGVDRVAAAAAAAAMLGEAAEMQELEREAAAVRAEGEQQLLAAAAGGDRQAAKAAGVRAQQRLWGNALELRIRLQKAVNGANRLPRPAAAAVLQSSNSQVAASYQQLRSACQDTLESMLQLHDALAQQHPAAAAALEAAAAAQPPQQQQPQAAAAAGSKRSRAAAGLEGEEGTPKAGRTYTGVCSGAAAAWAAVDGAIDSMAGFRDASLDKWHRRTVLSSGTAALRGSSGLRALQQSISSQVSQLMSADRAKLIARSQLPVQLAPRPLGQPAAADNQQQEQQQDGDDGSAAAVRGGDRARDPETYDEGDFYSQLLKQLLEAAPAGSVPAQLAAARPAKRRKVVDRRASKGRKLRFHTMDKLVGFMAPKELILPPFAEQLFGNLFSHEG